jgi:hypothetical protein
MARRVHIQCSRNGAISPLPRRLVLALVAAAGCLTFAPGGVSVAAAAGFTEVAAGYQHACAIRTNGSLVCWGSGGHGETDAPAGSYRSVTAGGSLTCATRLSDSSAVCWGWKAAAWQQSMPAGGIEWVGIGAHVCAVASGGNLTCWGYAPGAYPWLEDVLPLRPHPVPAGSFKSVTAGIFHTCAITTDDRLVCWSSGIYGPVFGSDEYGQARPPAGRFASVSAGPFHNCAIRLDGSLACWGSDFWGQSRPPAGSYTSVSAGDEHTCAVRSDGALICWGNNEAGQIDVPAGRFRVVASGSDFACAIRLNGELACWGDRTGPAGQPSGSGVTTPPASADADAPVTTIARTPVSPGGSHGWDVAPVHMSVWATDGPDGSGVAHTRCVLDPAREPVRFADLPMWCPYLGAGLEGGNEPGGVVSSDGHHVLYAASIDSAGNAEAPKRVAFKIDTTPPTVICEATPTTLLPRNHKLVDVHTEVAVLDALSGAVGFTLQSVTSSQPDETNPGDRPRDVEGWVVGSADTDGQLRAETRGGDSRVYRVVQQGTDQAGNTATCAATVTVPANVAHQFDVRRNP